MDELISLIPVELRAKVETGELEVLPGQNPAKPVIREVLTGRLVKGSGRYPKANDAAAVSKATAYKRSSSYRQGLELMIPLEGDETKVGSFPWLLKQAIEEAQGYDYEVRCPDCDTPVHVYKKRNAMFLFKFVEMLAGKARETQDLNIKSESLVAVLNAREPVREVIVHSIDPEIARQRREAIELAD